MDSRKQAFLQAILGADGAKALVKASVTPDLEWALVPRVVLAWLEVVAHGSYHGAIPGIEDTHLSLRKGEGDFNGSISIGTDTYTFRDASIYHVAGSMAVAMGLDHEPQPALKHPALAKLGKSIDVLVKSRTLRKAQEKHSGAARGVSAQGPAAAPKAPIPPVEPIGAQPKLPDVGIGTRVASTSKPTAPKTDLGVPGAKPKIPTPKALPKLPGVKSPSIKVTKSEAATPCPVCGQKQFDKDQYVSCYCFKDLVKSTKTSVVEGGYMLELGVDWDVEAALALAENLKG